MKRSGRSQKQRILARLGDRRWHSIAEFWAMQPAIRWPNSRLYELREAGCVIEKRLGDDGNDEWRLVSAPFGPTPLAPSEGSARQPDQPPVPKVKPARPAMSGAAAAPVGEGLFAARCYSAN